MSDLCQISERIRELARDPMTDMYWTGHVREQLDDRSVHMTDALFALRTGDVTVAPEPSTQPDLMKYRVDALSPNSDVRSIGVVVVPDFENRSIKILTVMWIDEYSTRAGSLMRGHHD